MTDLTLQGKILVIYPTQAVNDRFKKREFVLELTDEINGNTYTNYAKMQTVQAKCDLLDRFSEGENVIASFNVKGNKWEKDGTFNFITNLDVWKIQSAASNKPGDYLQHAKDPNPAPVSNSGNQAAEPQGYNVSGGDTKDDLPF